MDLRQVNGRSGNVGVLPSIVAPALFGPESESGVLRIGCLNVMGSNEVNERNEMGSMFEERKFDMLGLS